jgi:hypothetical protein
MTAALLVALAAAPPAVPPTRVTVPPGRTLAAAAADIGRATGLRLDVSAADAGAAFPPAADLPFWAAVQQAADRTGHRIAVTRQGEQIALVRGAGGPASIDGAFRAAARGVTAKADYDTGRTAYEVSLDLHWEPRFPVFRVDAQPTITTATDDRGTALAAPAGGAKAAVTGYAHPATVRLDGLTRKSASIARLAGQFTVTAAPRMLAFRFADLAAKPPVPQQQDGVTVTLTGFDRRDDRWDLSLRLEYPEGHPAFESFESWTGRNTLRLVSPDRSRVYDPDTFDVTETGRTATAVYRFAAGGRGPNLGDRKGWSVVYETPAPLAEFPVRFELKDLPLP